MKTEAELKTAGFTDSGITRYRNATVAYCNDLFAKSVALGDRDKADDAPREVTHELVRAAASEIARRGQNPHSTLQIRCQIGEILCAAGVGAGASNLDEKWGTTVFVVSIGLGVVLFVIRMTQSR
jgi:hypothetical protein